MNSPYGYSSGGGMPPQGGGYNPYAAPQVGVAPHQSPSGPFAYKAQSGALKWVYLGTLLGMYLFFGLGAAVGDDVGAAIIGLGALLFFARLVVALVWVHGAWSAIPAEYRVTAAGKRVSPGEAVGFLFVPFYNLYWMFVASMGVCDALDYLLQSSGSPRRAPKGLAMLSCIFQIVPYLNLLVAPFLWFFYMLSFDGAARALEGAVASASSGPPGGAPRGFGPGGYGAPPAGGYGAPPGGYGRPPGY